MVTMGGSKTNQPDILRMRLLWARKGKGAAYCEDFDWRFACRPLSLLLIGLLDSPSEKMSSIWDSLHVRSPSAGFRDGALVGLGVVCAFLSLASSGMMAVLYLGKECSVTTAPTAAAHYRERLMEYDPPVARPLTARCK
jgi:hypothetical protein